METMRENSGSMYLTGEDVVISSYGILDTVPHPYSFNTVHEDDFDKTLKKSTFGVGFKIEIVDNYGKSGDRFIYLGNRLERIRAQKNPHRLCGIYVTRLVNSLADNLAEQSTIVSSYDLNEGDEELGLFKTWDDALCKGDLAEVRREAILEAENNLADKRSALNKEKLEAEEIKFKQDKEMMVAKAELDRERIRLDGEFQRHELELKRKKLEMEQENQILKSKLESDALAAKEKEMELNKERDRVDRLRREYEYEQERKKTIFKDEMDRRAMLRKDSSDVMKFLPMMLIAIGGVFAAFMKIQPKT